MRTRSSRLTSSPRARGWAGVWKWVRLMKPSRIPLVRSRSSSRASPSSAAASGPASLVTASYRGSRSLSFSSSSHSKGSNNQTKRADTSGCCCLERAIFSLNTCRGPDLQAWCGAKACWRQGRRLARLDERPPDGSGNPGRPSSAGPISRRLAPTFWPRRRAREPSRTWCA